VKGLNEAGFSEKGSLYKKYTIKWAS
jgi:hypothetical protein